MEIDMADIRPSVASWIVGGLIAVTFIAFFKWFTAKYPVPGLSQLMAAV